MSDRRKVSEIKVGERTRTDVGDLSELAASMGRVGMLHPVVVNTAGELVAGYRRLEAAKRLGWEWVPVRVVATLDDALAALVAERDENVCRKDFLPSEAVAMGLKLEPMERAAAKERQRDHGGTAPGRPKNTWSESDQVFRPLITGRTHVIVADAVGMGKSKYDMAKAVVAEAEANPDRNGDLVTIMDEQSTSAAYAELRRRTSERHADRPADRPKKPGWRPTRGKTYIGQDEFNDLLRQSVAVSDGWAAKTGVVAFAKTLEDEERWKLCDTLEKLARQLSRVAVEMRHKA